jgi:flagellar biosynthesis chaperone FliJ
MLTEEELQNIQFEVTGQVTQMLEAYGRQHQVRLEKQDQLFDQFEHQLATLTQGYAELASLVEALLSLVVNETEEKRQEFFTHLRESRQTMVDTLRHATESAAESDDKFVAYGTSPVVPTPDFEEPE